MLHRASSGIAALLLAGAALLCAHAQVVDFDSERLPVVEIHNLWRFHTGDDPRWADPNFDDSGWPLLRPDESWSDQGYKGYGGMAWYRFKLLVPLKHQQLAIYFPALVTSFQVFVNGRLIGQEGGLPPHESVIEGGSPLYVIPGDTVNNSSISIAIRVWDWPYWAAVFGGGFLGGTPYR